MKSSASCLVVYLVSLQNLETHSWCPCKTHTHTQKPFNQLKWLIWIHRAEARIISYFKYGIVMYFSKDGFWSTNTFHSSMSIFPSPLQSASSNVYENSKSKQEERRRGKQKKTKKINKRNLLIYLNMILSVSSLTFMIMASIISSGSIKSNSSRSAKIISLTFFFIS